MSTPDRGKCLVKMGVIMLQPEPLPPQEGDFLSTLDASERKAVASLMQPRGLANGHNLCQEGDAANCIWLLQQGAQELRDVSVFSS